MRGQVASALALQGVSWPLAGQDHTYGREVRCSVTQAASCARDSSLSFLRILPTWVVTMRSALPSSEAWNLPVAVQERSR